MRSENGAGGSDQRSEDRAGFLSVLANRILSLCSRETSGAALIPQIDGLRFIAIASVVLCHLNVVVVAYLSQRTMTEEQLHADPGQQVTRIGYFGVQLFFAISGFVLGLPFAQGAMGMRPPVRMGNYFLRRLTRLEPPYIINLVVMAGILVALGKSESIGWLLRHLGASILYIHGFVYGQSSVINPVAWSLEVEVQFYVLVPLLAMIFAVKNALLRRGIIVGTMIAFGAGRAWSGQGLMEGTTILHQLQYFLVGFLLVDLYLNAWSRPSTHRGAWDIAGLLSWAGIVVVLLFCGHDPPGFLAWPHVVLPFLMLVAYAGAMRGRLVNAFVSNRWIFTIGGMCYTIYLWHLVLLTIGARVLSRFKGTGNFELDMVWTGVILIPVVLATSAVLFILFEKPFMKRDWPRRVRAWFGGASGA